MIYGGLFYMIFYTLDYVIEKTLKQNLSAGQTFLKKVTGKKFSKEEADYLWTRINDHKWYISEKLQRNVGLNVAAIDFFENIYQSETGLIKSKKSKNSTLQVYETLSSIA